MHKRIAVAALTAAGALTTLTGVSAHADPQPLGAAIVDTAPAYLYQLDDAAGSTTAADSSSATRRPLVVVDEPFAGSHGDQPITFDGAAATFGGAQYLRHGPAVRLNRHAAGAGGYRSFTLETTFTLPADMPTGTEYLADASGWRLSVSSNGAGHAVVGWADRAPQPDGVAGQLDAADDVAAGVHQVVAVGVHKTLTLYVDGREAFSRPMVRLHRGALSVGSFDGEAGNSTFIGVQRDVAAWKRPLGVDEIAALWAASA